MKRAQRAARAAGFTLLPVVLAMSLIAAIAFLLNRDNGMNAGTIARQSDLERARYAAEAGLQAVNYQVQQQGCAGGFPTSAAPVTNNNFGGAAYTAYANQATGFPLLLSSTGSYNGTSVTLSRANVQVFQSAMQTKVLQSGLTTVNDTYVDSSKTNKNYGTSTILLLDSTPIDMLLQFDLSTLPAGSRVIPHAVGGVLNPGAMLSLYQTKSNAGSSGAISAYLVTHSWLENSATWGSYDGTNVWPGGGYDSRALAAANYVAAIDWSSWDITDAAAAWMGSVYPNYGVRLRPPVPVPPSIGVNNVWYVSSNDTVNVTLRPKVTLNYLVPCSTTTTVTLHAIHDTYIDSFGNNAKTNYGTASTLLVYKSGSQAGRALLFFDLSLIPPGTTLTSATLQLYAASTLTPRVNSTLTVNKVSDPWTETGATWNKRDGSNAWNGSAGNYFGFTNGAPTSDLLIPSSFVSGGLAWNVKDLAQQWVASPSTNYGLGLMFFTDANPGINFTSQNGGPANQPQLVITY